MLDIWSNSADGGSSLPVITEDVTDASGAFDQIVGSAGKIFLEAHCIPPANAELLADHDEVMMFLIGALEQSFKSDYAFPLTVERGASGFCTMFQVQRRIMPVEATFIRGWLVMQLLDIAVDFDKYGPEVLTHLITENPPFLEIFRQMHMIF